MALKRLDTVAETAPKTKKDDIPLVDLKGTLVTDFIKADNDLEDAKARREIARKEILEVGLGKFFAHNVNNATKPATSMKFADEKQGVCRLSFQDKYSAADADTVDALFESLGQDANELVQETAVASFDSKIFNTGSNGVFSRDIYDTYAMVIEEATKTLILEGKLPQGTVSPLKTAKKVLPLADFHAKRWALFPNVPDQRRITEVISNTTTLSASKL